MAFTFAEDPIALPKGAHAGTHRQALRRDDGRMVLALTQGNRRAYAYPLMTPAGFAVTSEAPADHPHHNSLWIGADHVHAQVPAADDRIEEYTYNFYVNDVFQGRAPGRTVASTVRDESTGPASHRLEQTLEWRGPVEWAAPEGRLILQETRTYDISDDGDAYIVDVTSRLEAGTWDVAIGPTRHAFFNVRVSESIAATSGGTVVDDRGMTGGAITGNGARWVDYSGPVGGGHVAGVTVCPHPADHDDITWFASDWGVVTVGPFRLERRLIVRDRPTTLRYRTIVHDGAADTARIGERLSGWLD